MVNKALFSRDRDDWETPPEFFQLLDAEFHFTLDPCADAQNAKCDKFFTKEMDGLVQPWAGHVVYVNPPYSQIKTWVGQCWTQMMVSQCTIVLLIPSRTDTRYWHRYITNGSQWPGAAELRFVKGRLKFVGGKHSAPFPSVVVVFRPDHTGPPTARSMERR